MTEGVIVAAIAAVVAILGQWALHRRWTAEQDAKRDGMLARLAEDRQAESDRQDAKRQADQAEILSRMAEQNSTVVANALRVAEIHQEDAERARLLALENAKAHSECRQEVAHLAGKVDELRTRIAENELSMGDQQRIADEDRALKHASLTALTISEGTVDLVKKLVPDCTCAAFKPIEHLVTSFHPQAPALVEANSRIRHIPTVEEP